MDQTASSVGGVVAIDFADTDHPVVERIGLNLRKDGYALCILDSGAGHADLTDEYAAITDELKAVCRHFGKEYLRQVPWEDFLTQLPQVRREAGDRPLCGRSTSMRKITGRQSRPRPCKTGTLTAFWPWCAPPAPPPPCTSRMSCPRDRPRSRS